MAVVRSHRRRHRQVPHAGRDPGGWIVTILLGIAGSFVGGFLASTLMGRQEQTAGWIGSIIGAIVLLFIYRLIVGRRTVV